MKYFGSDKYFYDFYIDKSPYELGAHEMFLDQSRMVKTVYESMSDFTGEIRQTGIKDKPSGVRNGK